MNCMECKHLIRSVELFKPMMRCARIGLDKIEWVDWHSGCEYRETDEIIRSDDNDQMELFK